MSAPAAVHPAPAVRALTPAALWFGLFGAPVAWSLQLLASYALVAHGCYPDAEPMAMPVVPGLRTLVLGTGVANGAGGWSINSSVLAQGAHTVTAKQTDIAGNTNTAAPTRIVGAIVAALAMNGIGLGVYP